VRPHADVDTSYLAENVLPSIEPVKIIYPDGRAVISPDLSWRQTQAHASYINSCTGLNLSAPQVKDLLERMSLRTVVASGDADTLNVAIPPTRPDILHECDIMEDAAIAYGFNNLPNIFPATSTVAQPLAVSKLSDVIRHEWAFAGWVEVLPLILVCHLLPSKPSQSRWPWQPFSLTNPLPPPPPSVFLIDGSALTKRTLHGSTRPTTAKRR
jgi:phenylalanyl-tRNA synthetase beta subunit